MKLEPECIGCLFNQIVKAFELLKPDTTREVIISAQKKLMNYLLNLNTDEKAAPLVGKELYSIVAEILGEKDPYWALKNKYNQLALKYYDDLKKLIEDSEDSLFFALVVAALGNTIDFASQHEIDIVSDIKNFQIESLALNDYIEFRKSIDKAKHLLILGDNAGEIVFDKLLVLNIKDLYPKLEIIYSVRSSPIINDATIEDAKFISLTDLVQVVESSATPGVDIATSTEEFKEIFSRKEGVILSKGQGNFETLYGLEIPQKDIYYLLKVKCNLMERIFNVKIGDLIFKKKIQGF